MTRQFHGVRFCAMGTVLVVSLYVLSFGPACWWFSAPMPPDIEWLGVSGNYAPVAYWPIGHAAHWSHRGSVWRVIAWYATVGHAEVYLPTEADGRSWLGVRR